MEKNLMILIYVGISINIFAGERGSSYPYITGDTFRAHSNFILDEAHSFNPKNVFDKAIIFVRRDYLSRFFSSYHPNIAVRYLLITHNGCPSISEEFRHYLDDPKLIAWFAQNMLIKHPKAICIPVGFANRCWPHGEFKVYDAVIEKAQNGIFKKKTMLYMNFNVKTYPPERTKVWNMFKDKPFCTIGKRKIYREFLEDLAESIFVLSPRGGGFDCLRVWETLLVGNYPIVKKSPIDSVYEELPIVFINDWSEVTEEFLNLKYKELLSKKFDYSKLLFPYWLDKIKSFLDNC